MSRRSTAIRGEAYALERSDDGGVLWYIHQIYRSAEAARAAWQRLPAAYAYRVMKSQRAPLEEPLSHTGAN